MRKIWNIVFVAFAAAAFTVACTKASELDVTKEEVPQGEQKEGHQARPMTITATIPADIATKVNFTPDVASGKLSSMQLTWQATDVLRVYNHADKTKYADFELKSGADLHVAIFGCDDVSALDGATYYDVEINASFANFAEQTQASNGNTEHLKYLASVTEISDYSSVSFTELSSVLAIVAKMPSQAVAATITSVDITASADIFNGGNTLRINISDAGSTNDILNLYATLPQGNQAIVAGTTLLVRFNSSNEDHTVYTRYIVLPAQTFNAGELNTININASQSDKHAGVCSGENACDGSTAAKAYLIGDKYQMNAMQTGMMVPGQTTYYKLVDDIDMDGESWTPLNPDPYTKAVNLDGNNHKIMNLCASLFDDLNGTVTNLTIEDATVYVSTKNAITGILANTVKTAASTVTNVDVSGTGTSPSYSSSVTGASYTGGLIGQIDVGNTAITNCDVVNTNVSGTLAAGVIGFANALVTMSGCTYNGGTVTASARYCGGMLGSTSNYKSVITDCHVENATINNTATADVRTGGFVGQLHTNVQVKGCSVGTSSQRVIVQLATPAAAGSKLNAGGFAGTSYGTITKNGDVRTTAYVTVTCSNPSAETNAGYELNLGGFTGYHQGTIEYTDANVEMTDICGKYVGGFCGLQNGGTIRYCTVTGSVSGNNAVGGFIGYANAAGSTLTECSSSAIVSRTGTWGSEFGSFGGFIDAATITKCYATSDPNVNANYVGGFIGGVSTSADKTTTIQKCWSTGNMGSSSAQCGGFIGHIAANASGTVNIYDCYSTGNLTGGNQRKGGFIGQINSGNVTISRCYATGTLTTGSFAQGGLVGFMNATATIEDCAAWNSSVTASSIGNGNWSTGAVVGVAWPIATLTNNFRKPEMNVKAYWGNVTGYTKQLTADYDHPNVSSSNPLIVVDKTDGTTLKATTATSAASGQDNYPLFAYHGKHVAPETTLSTLASTAKASGGLGWSGDVWDFSGPLPLLK